MASEHWRNCDLEDGDAEIAQIDAQEELLEGDARADALAVRRLITGFEICHHNTLRWAERIARAIADGAVPAPSGRKRSEHPVTIAHLNLRRLLADVVDGGAGERAHGEIPAMDAARLAQSLAAAPARERWLLGLVLDNLEHHLHDADLIPSMRTADNRMFPGAELDVANEDQARAYFADSFEHYMSYRDAAVRLVDEGHRREKESRLPLLLVVQFANPCSVNYFRYVASLLDAVGAGEQVSELPFPFCGHCSGRQRAELRQVAGACQSFLSQDPSWGPGEAGPFGDPDDGGRAKRWLVASFGKTLRLQLGE